jgi:hypothetical protein
MTTIAVGQLREQNGLHQHHETDPQRIATLTAADRLLAGTPKRSTGNLSIVQLAVEANVKYWVVAQKHADLRDHFQRLVVPARKAAAAFRETQDPAALLQREHKALKAHCKGLEQLLQTYATVINELSVQNEALQSQIGSIATTVTPFRRFRQPPPEGPITS